MIKKLVHFLLHIGFLIIRPLTIGVRGICFDEVNNKVFLVKHTYSNDWALPGGGVEVGESMENALQRELKEEAGLYCNKFSIVDVFHNLSVSRRDHVVIYFVDTWQECENHSTPKFEISNTKWFSLDDLPKNLSPCSIFALKNIKRV